MRVSAQFGAPTDAAAAGGGSTPGALTKIYDGTKGVNDAETVLTFAAGSQYLMVTETWTTNNDRVYASTIQFLSTPRGSAFGTVAITHVSLGSSGGTGVQVAYPADTTVKWSCPWSGYEARLRVYKLE